MYCVKCGKELPVGKSTCAYCGEENQQKTAALVNKGIFALIAGIIAAVVIGIFVINLFSVILLRSR